MRIGIQPELHGHDGRQAVGFDIKAVARERHERQTGTLRMSLVGIIFGPLIDARVLHIRVDIPVGPKAVGDAGAATEKLLLPVPLILLQIGQ